MKQSMKKRIKTFVVWFATFSITLYLYDFFIAHQGYRLEEFGLAIGVAFILAFTNLATPTYKKNTKKS
ncbi:hypothetical protein [Domibacillus tundrae]|uniref:hypothetical protein n=1 Tax=Domibacillus tundrae TaxID=1587527 RepID=UPI00061827F9|nr:hypothetical protein [Domibacillus tundrae]